MEANVFGYFYGRTFTAAKSGDSCTDYKSVVELINGVIKSTL